jgi:hypothetical protein
LTVFLTDLIHPQNLFAFEAIAISFLEKSLPKRLAKSLAILHCMHKFFKAYKYVFAKLFPKKLINMFLPSFFLKSL